MAPSFQAVGRTWEIRLAEGRQEEQRAFRQLKDLLAKHDLRKWIFTSQVLIDFSCIPHSHPILTLNTKYLDRDDEALGVFLHEQIHWFLDNNEEKTEAAIRQLRYAYPDAPKALPEGGRNEFSTYLHLIVNSLEYLALEEILGTGRSRAVLESSARTHYKWIYGKALSDVQGIRTVLREHGLLPETC